MAETTEHLLEVCWDHLLPHVTRLCNLISIPVRVSLAWGTIFPTGNVNRRRFTQRMLLVLQEESGTLMTYGTN